MNLIVSRNTARATTVVSSLYNTNTTIATLTTRFDLHLLPKVNFSTFSYSSRFLFHNNVVGIVDSSIKVPTLFINKKNFSSSSTTTTNSDERYAFLNNNSSTPTCSHHYSEKLVHQNQNQNLPSSFGGHYHHHQKIRAIESKRNKLRSGQDRSFSSSDNGNGSYYHYRQLQRRKNRHYSGGIVNSQYEPHKFSNWRPPIRVPEVIVKDGKGGIVPDDTMHCSDMPLIGNADSWELDNEEGQGSGWWGSVPVPPEVQLTTTTREVVPCDSMDCSDVPLIGSADSWEWDNDEGQGYCWWGSVPVPPELQLTTPTGWGSVPVPPEVQLTPTVGIVPYDTMDCSDMLYDTKGCSDMPLIGSADSWEWDNDEGQGYCWWGSVPVPPELLTTPIEQLDDFLKNNQVEEAVKLLKDLEEKKGIFVDLPGYLQLIQACAEEGTLPYAKDVHNNLIRSTIPIDVNTYNRILDMYSECGSMSDAYEVFEKNMPERNIMSWDIMIRGLAKNDLGENAIDLFTQFKEEGLKPNGQIFMGVFLACSFLCDVGEGMLHFESMSKVYNIVPSMEHYWGVVNMLGSAGYLEEAMEFVRKMPFTPSVDVWETLMNLCRVHGNIELGCHCAKIVNCLDTSCLTDKSENGLVLGKASDAKETMKEELNIKKLMDAKFIDGDTSHPGVGEILAFLRKIIVNLKAEGYVPDARYALYDLEEEDKEAVSLHHCEKIIVAAGCLWTKPRGWFKFSVRNTCLCNDCHNAIKAISKLVGRRIIMTNGKTHYFEDGLCSCKDFW